MEKTIDARGLMCPKPVIMTKRELADMEAGTVTTIVDNDTAVGNIKAFAEAEGMTAESRAEGADFYVSVTKTAATRAAAGAPGRVVVLINDDQFGGGDDKFGETLMKNFIFALTEAEPKPTTMLFVNAGAYFTCAGSAVLESLQTLEKAGVEIMTCGACLDFYNLKDSLSVGSVTNMYVIAEKLLNASHVVKP